jgi:hypothetical protein
VSRRYPMAAPPIMNAITGPALPGGNLTIERYEDLFPGVDWTLAQCDAGAARESRKLEPEAHSRGGGRGGRRRLGPQWSRAKTAQDVTRMQVKVQQGVGGVYWTVVLRP